MKLRLAALTALAALSFNANAGLTTYAQWDAAHSATGLNGVQFNVTNVSAAWTGITGASVAMGAHPYTSGVTMPNNGTNTYYADAGRATPLRANWNFDYAWDFGNCQGCSVQLFVDTDPTAGTHMQQLLIGGSDSWNLEMSFMPGALGGYDFDPFSASSTAFSLRMLNSAGVVIAESDITVNVPEPGSLALLGLGLVGMGALTRRRIKG